MKQTISVKKYQLPIEIKKEGDYFLAFSPSWSDCYAQGSTIDEATAEIVSVAASLIELYKEEEMEIPLFEFKESSSQAKISFNVPIYACA